MALVEQYSVLLLELAFDAHAQLSPHRLTGTAGEQKILNKDQGESSKP